MAETVSHDAATLEALGKAKLMDAMYDNPKLRGQFLRLIKEQEPNARIPEIEAETTVLAAIKPHMEEIGKAKLEIETERANIKAERAAEKAKKELALSDEEFEEVKKHAAEKQIGDLVAAAEHWQMTKEVAEPRSMPDTTIQLPNIKGLWENPMQFARDEARKVQHEFKIAAQRRR